MNGYEYEYKCAKILKRKGFSKVEVTKESGDQGIDIIAYRNGKKYGIQCKYYTSPVGNHAVQEVFAGAKYYNCDIAVVMTNNTFTSSAKELAQKTNVLLWNETTIPLTTHSFWLTKFIGIFFCIISILGLITIRTVDNIKLPLLQVLELTFLMIGSFLAIFEYGKWKISLLSSTFYFLSAFMNLILCIALRDLSRYDSPLLIIAFISFARTDYLYNKTYSHHIWKAKSLQSK